jgi:two-component system, cell cycle sensor histidine kinase and response regulator CckA
LIIEDEASVRDLSAAFLKRQGYRIITAANAGEAILYAETQTAPIDLLLADVVLPGMNGREVAERIQRAHAETAVLFTSGYTEDTIVRRGVLSDTIHFVGKPYSLQTLAHKVRQVLDAHKRPR